MNKECSKCFIEDLEEMDKSGIILYAPCSKYEGNIICRRINCEKGVREYRQHEYDGYIYDHQYLDKGKNKVNMEIRYDDKDTTFFERFKKAINDDYKYTDTITRAKLFTFNINDRERVLILEEKDIKVRN